MLPTVFALVLCGVFTVAAATQLTPTDLQFLVSTVNVLNTDRAVETNVLLEFTETASEQYKALARHINVPKLTARHTDADPVQLVIKSHFPRKVLSIVLLHGHENVYQVWKLLKSILWKLHHTDVLFVNVSKRTKLPLKHIFQHCWYEGFTNVLVLSQKRYYTYHRFPNIRVVELSTLHDYYNRTHMRNWHGHPLRSTVLYGSPRSYHYIDRVTGEARSAGYLYNLIIDFAKHYNATFERVLIGANHTDLELACRAFESRQIDIMTTILYSHPGYSGSIVVEILHVYVVVPHAQPVRNYLYLIKPLKRWAWLAIGFTGILMFALLAVFYHVQDTGMDFSAALLQTISILFYLPHNPRPVSNHAKWWFLLMIIASGFFINIYTSCLSSMFTSKLFEPQIMKYSDIDRTHLLLLKAEVDIEVWKNLSSMSRIIKDRLRTVTPKQAYQLLHNLSTEHLLADTEDRVNFFMYQQKFLKVPRVKKLDRVLHTIPVYIPFPHNSPYLQLFNVYLRRSVEHGLYRKFVDEANDEGIKNGEISFFESDYTPFMPLGFSHLDVVFIDVLVLGLLIASIVFVMELMHYHLIRL